MNEDRLRSALKNSLSGMDFPAARQQEVWRIIKGEKTMKPKKLSIILACLLIVLTIGTALGAALGVFGRLSSREITGDSAGRLALLEQEAPKLETRVSLDAPASSAPPAQPQTVYDQLLARQYERSFDLTVNQAYCDGNKLYFSYTLTTDGRKVWTGEGMPSGISEWMMQQPGRRYAEVWSHSEPERDKAIIHWLDSHESSWYAYENCDLGDGVDLADGRYCDILDGTAQWLDENTLYGFREVQLPADMAETDAINMELSLMYSATLFYQDAQGVFCANIRPAENRGILRLPVSIPRTGITQSLSGSAIHETYTAQADVRVSPIDLSGTVTLTCPVEWTEAADHFKGDVDYLECYKLVADGHVQRNLDVSLHVLAPGQLQSTLRFDLPVDTRSLVLRPVYFLSGEHPAEDIPLQ